MKVSKTTAVKMLLLLSCASLCVSCKEQLQETEIEMGYRGEARINPFLAAERLLSALGVTAHSVAQLKALPDIQDTLVINAAVINDALTNRYYDWVQDGGHLVYLVAGGTSFNDWNSDTNLSATTSVADHPLLDRFHLKIEPLSEDRETQSVQLNGNLMDADIDAEVGIVDDFIADAVYRDQGEGPALFYSFASGFGRLSVLTNANPWRNRYIGELDHAQFLAELVDLQTYGQVWLVYGTHISLWVLLWEYAWMPVISVLCLLAVWLWSVIPRQGPVYAYAAVRPSFMSHIEMSGRFLWKHRCSATLVEPLRKQIRLNFQRLYLSELTLGNPKHMHELSVRSGLPADEIAAALTATIDHDINRMTSVVKNLQTIIKHL